MALPPKWYQFFICLFASLGALLYGYDLVDITGPIIAQNFVLQFRPSRTEIDAIVPVLVGGAFFGALLAGLAGDWLGRKKTMFLGSLISLVGGALQTGARGLSYLYTGRLIAGIGGGLLLTTIPPYQAEICHPDIRGRVTALQQFMVVVGALVAYWVSYGAQIGFSFHNSAQWRLTLGVQLILAGLLAAFVLLLPESPRWLIDHDRIEEGRCALAKLYSNGNENDALVRAEFEQIQEQISFEHEHQAQSYTELFRNKSCFRRLLLATSIQASVQLSGSSAFQYYTPLAFEQIGISDNKLVEYLTISACIALVASFCCILFVDYTGRRWAMIGGNLVNCVACIVATILLARFLPGSSTGDGWGFIVVSWIFNFSFYATNGPLSWIVPAEIFDIRTRLKGVSFVTMTSFAFSTMIDQVTSIALFHVGYRFYYLFIVCNLTNALFFWAVLPELTKRPLEEMNHLFTNAPIFVPKMNKQDYEPHELRRQVAEIQMRRSVTSQVE